MPDLFHLLPRAARALAGACALLACVNAFAAPPVRAASWAVVDESGRLIAGAAADEARPIASITKLMMAMAYLDSAPDLAATETISEADVDTVKMSSSRLPVGATLVRSDLLRLALASSENRAAGALARGYRGGVPGMVAAMNAKARALGLAQAHFVDATGLSPLNVASARDVAKMTLAARAYPQALAAAKLSEYGQALAVPGAEPVELGYENTNKPLRMGLVAPLISKTGYIKEAGKCLGWALGLSNGKAAGLSILGSKSFSARDADELALSSWIEQAGLLPAPPALAKVAAKASRRRRA